MYEFTMYVSGNIWFERDSVLEKHKFAVEGGDFLRTTYEGDTLMIGKYQHGFKIGIWEYHPTDTQTLYIDWDKYRTDDFSFEINYPKEWELIPSKTRPFQATFPTKSEMKDDKYFVILSHKKAEIDMSLKDYWNHSNHQIHTGDSVSSHLLIKFSREDGDYYFSTYTIVRNGEEMFIFSFLGETDSMIYDVSYVSLKEDITKKYTIFLDMIRSLRLENERFFTPYGQSTKIINLKWPPEPEIIN